MAAINFNSRAGDKHISIDRIKDGLFKAKDLRLRFEFGGGVPIEALSLPTSDLARVTPVTNGIRFSLQMYKAVFDAYEGHWETGGDGRTVWLDYVVYDGQEKTFDFNLMKEAIWGFTFSMAPDSDSVPQQVPSVSVQNHIMDVTWQDLTLQVPTNIRTLPPHL